jgi:hypothetical protein
MYNVYITYNEKNILKIQININEYTEKDVFKIINTLLKIQCTNFLEK